MKIPVYVSEQGVSAPQMRTPQVPKPLELGAVVNALEARYQEQENVRLDEMKIFTETELQRTSLDIDKKYMELQDRIASGGSYAGAEKEFQKFYDSRVKGSVQKLGQDPVIAQRAALQYERSGVEYDLRLKSAIRERAKKDAVASANERSSLYERELFDAVTPQDQANVVKKYSQMISGLEASGIISDGKERLRKFISNGVEQKSQFMAQQDPVAAFEYVEQNKDLLDVDSYVSLRGQLKVKRDAVFDNQYVESLYNDFYNGVPYAEPEQSEIDGQASDVSRQLEAQQITPEQFEQALSRTLVSTGKVPTIVGNSVKTLFSLGADEINPSSAKEVAMYARIVASATSANAGLINGKGGISKEAQSIADIITKKTQRGVDETTAVRETLMRYNDPSFGDVYEKARKEVLTTKKSMFGKSSYESFIDDIKSEYGVDNFGANFVRDRVIDDYATARAMGASHGDAFESALKRNEGVVGKFNGTDVVLPPHRVTTFRDEGLWIEMGKQKLQEMFPSMGDKMIPVIQGDSITERYLKDPSKKSYEIPFRLMYRDADGSAIPLNRRDENGIDTGLPLYVRANPEFKETKEMKQRRLPGGGL